MKRKNMTAQIAAIVALIAILGSIVGTGVLVIYESFFTSNNSENSLTQEQLQELLQSYSGSVSSGTGIELGTGVTSSGEILEIQNINTLTETAE